MGTGPRHRPGALGWVLGLLGWADFQDWPAGHSWRAPDGGYLVVEQSSALSAATHDRLRPGVNHVALTAPRSIVDTVAADGAARGWHLMFPDRHPWAGGPEHYAAFLADDDGYELELVAG